MAVRTLLRKIRHTIRPPVDPDRLPTPTEPPWFERPDAIQWLEQKRARRAISDFEFDRLRKWVTDGYFVVEGMLPRADLEAMNHDIDDLWTTDRVRPGLTIHGLDTGDGRVRDVPHEEIIALPQERRLELRDGGQRWRIHGFIFHSEPTQRIAFNQAMSRWLSLIYDRPARATNSINFLYGSTQNLHQDMAVFPIRPANYLVGVWIAAQDVTPDCGPLVYYPGSHKDPMWPGFDGYPEHYCRTCKPETREAYDEYVKNLASRYEKHQFLAKTGDVLFWHGMIIHGGEKDTVPGKTRKSLVLHSVPKGCDITDQLPGPFNW